MNESIFPADDENSNVYGSMRSLIKAMCERAGIDGTKIGDAYKVLEYQVEPDKDLWHSLDKLIPKSVRTTGMCRKDDLKHIVLPKSVPHEMLCPRAVSFLKLPRTTALEAESGPAISYSSAGCASECPVPSALEQDTSNEGCRALFGCPQVPVRQSVEKRSSFHPTQENAKPNSCEEHKILDIETADLDKENANTDETDLDILSRISTPNVPDEFPWNGPDVVSFGRPSVITAKVGKKTSPPFHRSTMLPGNVSFQDNQSLNESATNMKKTTVFADKDEMRKTKPPYWTIPQHQVKHRVRATPSPPPRISQVSKSKEMGQRVTCAETLNCDALGSIENDGDKTRSTVKTTLNFPYDDLMVTPGLAPSGVMFLGTGGNASEQNEISSTPPIPARENSIGFKKSVQTTLAPNLQCVIPAGKVKNSANTTSAGALVQDQDLVVISRKRLHVFADKIIYDDRCHYGVKSWDGSVVQCLKNRTGNIVPLCAEHTEETARKFLRLSRDCSGAQRKEISGEHVSPPTGENNVSAEKR